MYRISGEQELSVIVLTKFILDSLYCILERKILLFVDICKFLVKHSLLQLCVLLSGEVKLFLVTLSLSSLREQPIFSTRAHVFQIDPNTKKNWVPTSKHAVTVSYFYDSTRNVYRIISLDGSKVSYAYFR